MNPKVQALLLRLKEVEAALSSNEAMQDQKNYRLLTQEHSRLSEIQALSNDIEKLKGQLEDNSTLLKSEKDQEFIEVLREDSARLQQSLEHAENTLQNILVPPGPHDHGNTILEMRAGAGGQEAALFVADCARMYQFFANHMGWKCEPLSCTESDLGGYKEYIAVFSGKNVYRYLQYEAGTHRVQRVPETEAQGRVHTSTITVAILLEPEDDESVSINEADLRIETTRSSGAGGQHVNKTDSAVRITHIPTGTVVFCQEERSQHKNKDKAMRLLRAKIAESERRKKKEEIDAKRLQQVGTGDRAEKIRTYNFPQNRVTDHRVNLTKYNLDRVMLGDLDDFSNQLIAYFQDQ